MKIIKRRIITLVTEDESYVFGDTINDGLMVRDIGFRRDGQLGINRSNNGDDAHYVVILVNRDNEKDIWIECIPAKMVKRIRCVDIEEETDENNIEVKKG